MPQLDPTTFVPQLVWLAITFGVLYLVMARFALPKVADMVEGRKARIEGDVAAAEAMRRESEALDEAYGKKLAEARARAAASVKAEKAKIEAKLAERRQAFEQEIAAKIDAAGEKIAAAKKKGLAEAGRVSDDISGAIIARLAGN